MFQMTRSYACLLALSFYLLATGCSGDETSPKKKREVEQEKEPLTLGALEFLVEARAEPEWGEEGGPFDVSWVLIGDLSADGDDVTGWLAVRKFALGAGDSDPGFVIPSVAVTGTLQSGEVSLDPLDIPLSALLGDTLSFSSFSFSMETRKGLVSGTFSSHAGDSISSYIFDGDLNVAPG